MSLVAVQPRIRVAAACADAINATGAETILVLDTYDAEAFVHRYADWGVQIRPRIRTATAFVHDLVRRGKLRLAPRAGEVTYHDPSRLARDLDEHAPARALIESAGLSIREMFLNRRLARCCGNALVDRYDPKLVAMTSAGRWEDALRTGARTLVTACPQAYLALSRAAPEAMRLEDLFMLLDGVSL